MDLSKWNTEINWNGKHVKISLVTIASTLFGISQTPTAMVLLGISPATAAAIPAAVTAVVSIAAPIIGALVYQFKEPVQLPPPVMTIRDSTTEVLPGMRG